MLLNIKTIIFSSVHFIHYIFLADPTYTDFFDSNGNKVRISRYQLRFDTVRLFWHLKLIVEN